MKGLSALYSMKTGAVCLLLLLAFCFCLRISSCGTGWPQTGNVKKAVDGTAYASFDLSPDGKTVVFAGIGNGGKDLYLLDLRSRHVSRLASTPDYENDPAYSPDGKSVIYEDAVSLDKPRYLFIRSIDGKHVRQLTSGTPTEDTRPSFSRDGKRVVFTRSSTYRSQSRGEDTWDNSDVYVADVNGRNLKRLTTLNSHSDIVPTFTPDGKHIIFAYFDDNQGDSHGVQVDLSGHGALHSVVQLAGGLRLLPNGAQLLYVSSDVNGYEDLFVRDLKGGPSTPLNTYFDGAGGTDPVVSADGKWVYYLRGYGELWRVKIDGSYKEMIADGGIFNDPMHWQPGNH
ncbi:MAG: TolB family protein [Capsulimonadaceae bacterium]